MNRILKRLNKAMVAVGVACLLLGVAGYSQPARGSLIFDYGSIRIGVTGTDHFSYGNWSYGSGSWIAENTADAWVSGSVYFSFEWGWTAWVLYSLYNGWAEEVSFLYDVNY